LANRDPEPDQLHYQPSITSFRKNEFERPDGYSQEDLLFKVIDLTSANILALNSVDFELIPAPGAGKMIIVEEAVIVPIRGNIDYTGTPGVGIYYSNPLAAAVASTLNHFAGATIVCRHQQNSVAQAKSTVENKSIVLHASSAYSAGNGIGRVFIWYRVLNIGV